MDYKYIEQLLDRYFECETSIDEEQILRAFFAQEDVPVRLIQYRELFCEAKRQQQEDVLGDDFDKKILSIIGQQDSVVAEPIHVKARVVSLNKRLRPLYKAAACVAVVLALGQAAQMPYIQKEAEQENIARSKQIRENIIRKDVNKVAQGDSVTSKKEL